MMCELDLDADLLILFFFIMPISHATSWCIVDIIIIFYIFDTGKE